MAKYTTAIAAAVLVAALAACGDAYTASAELPQHEQRYLNAVYEGAREEGSGFHALGDERVLELGRAVCEDLETTAPADVVRQLKNTNPDELGSPAPVASEVVGAAQLHLCPQAGDVRR